VKGDFMDGSVDCRALVAGDYIDNSTLRAQRCCAGLAESLDRARAGPARPPRRSPISLTAARCDGKIAAFEVEGISNACVQAR
jgi:hypothetical protein